MAQSNIAFYAKDPLTTPDQLKAALEAKYPNFKAYYRAELFNIGAKNKNGVYIQLDQSPVTGIKVSIDTNNMVVVFPNMGSGCLGFLLGWLEFIFMDTRLTNEVGEYLRATFGETDLLACTNCNKIYPHYFDKCPNCGVELTPYNTPSSQTPLIVPSQISPSQANISDSAASSTNSSPVGSNALNHNSSLPFSSDNTPRLRNRGTAIFLEILPGLFGLFGFGWIYGGKTGRGIALLVCGVVWWIISISVAALTATASFFCTIPVNLIVTGISTLILANYTKSHPELFL